MLTPPYFVEEGDCAPLFVQGIIPYGAQILVAIAAIDSVGLKISAFEIIPNLFYPIILLVMSILFILFVPVKTRAQYYESMKR